MLNSKVMKEDLKNLSTEQLLIRYRKIVSGRGTEFAVRLAELEACLAEARRRDDLLARLRTVTAEQQRQQNKIAGQRHVLEFRKELIEELNAERKQLRAERDEARQQLADLRARYAMPEIGGGVVGVFGPLLDAANAEGEDEAWAHLQESEDIE